MRRFLCALDSGIDAVTQCAAPAARAGAPGGLAAQPVFIFQPVEGGFYRFILGQAAPLMAAHIAQCEAIFERPAVQLGRQSLPCSQPVILEQPVAAPGMGLKVLAPSRCAQCRFLRDGAGNTLRRLIEDISGDLGGSDQLSEVQCQLIRCFV
jgi:hypothetical protein